ncbi:MAG TPA: hypothetical protein PLG50_11460 [bacterium]|nr:hypothetical protein [bacterium]HQG46265.1 hypothetical protein [bacterium]HQI49856.1 hypothetical protein [bacterium]HQJ65873.1 hypothetical protein [bacterium]
MQMIISSTFSFFSPNLIGGTRKEGKTTCLREVFSLKLNDYPVNSDEMREKQEMVRLTEQAEKAMGKLTAEKPRLYQLIIGGFG